MANANSSEGAAAVAGTTGGTTDDLKSRFQAGSIPLDTDFSELIDIAECGRRAIGQSADQTDNSVGAGMQVAPDSDAANKGKLSLKTGLGLGIDSADHSVRATVHTGYGMDVDANGLKVKIGNGVEFDSNGNVAVKAGSGIMVDSNGVSLNASIAFVKGMIMMFSGTSIPEGWALCDGTPPTPDLRGRFVLGSSIENQNAKNSVAMNTSDPNNQYVATTSDSKTPAVTVTIAGTVLQPEHIPSGLTLSVHNAADGTGYSINAFHSPADVDSGGNDYPHCYYADFNSSDTPTSTSTLMFARNDITAYQHDVAHGHSVSSAKQDAHSHTINVTVPYYCLVYIMKL